MSRCRPLWGEIETDDISQGINPNISTGDATPIMECEGEVKSEEEEAPAGRRPALDLHVEDPRFTRKQISLTVTIL